MATDSKNLKLCRVTKNVKDAFDASTPASGSIYWDETEKSLRVGDGSTAGGIAIPGDLSDEIHALKPFAGGMRSVYVSAVYGDDSNDGKTRATAIKTLTRAMEIFNSMSNVQYNIYLLGSQYDPDYQYEKYIGSGTGSARTMHDSGSDDYSSEEAIEYTLPSSVGIIAQGCPHFFAVEGKSRLIFGYSTASRNFRFYGGHLNLSSNNASYDLLEITTSNNSYGWYIEGTAVGVSKVSFLVPVSVVAGSFYASNVRFNANGFDDGTAAFHSEYSIVKMKDTTINNTGNNTGLYISFSCIATIYGELNVQKVASNVKNIIYTNNSFCNLQFTSNAYDIATSYRYKNVLLSNNSLINTTKEKLVAWKSYGLDTDNSWIHTGNNEEPEWYTGETLTLEGINCSGFINSSRKQLVFSLPIYDKISSAVSSVKINFTNMYVRGVSGAIVASANCTNGTNITTSDSSYTGTISSEIPAPRNALLVTCTSSTAISSATANTPICVYLGSVTLSF